jgi:hypothetical protein
MPLDSHKAPLQLVQHLMHHNLNMHHVAQIREAHQEVEEKFHSNLKPTKPLTHINRLLPGHHSIKRQQTNPFLSKLNQIHITLSLQVMLHKHFRKVLEDHNMLRGELGRLQNQIRQFNIKRFLLNNQ